MNRFCTDRIDNGRLRGAGDAAAPDAVAPVTYLSPNLLQPLQDQNLSMEMNSGFVIGGRKKGGKPKTKRIRRGGIAPQGKDHQ